MALQLSFSIADTLLRLDILISALSITSWLSCNWYCIWYLTFPFLVLSIQLDFHISGIVLSTLLDLPISGLVIYDLTFIFLTMSPLLDHPITDLAMYDLSILFLVLSATTWLFLFWYCHLWLNSPFSCLVLFCLANYDCPIFGLYKLWMQLDFLVPCTCALGLLMLSSYLY